MTTQDIAAAMQRVEKVLQRRPATGLHDDAPATARWHGGLRVTARHATGMELATDMPAELGGSGSEVSPGWLLRAGLASCSLTLVAMTAAARGIELTLLEARAASRSDTRGLLGMADAGGAPVHPGPGDLQMDVRIAARGVAPQRLRALVEESLRCSPVLAALQYPAPVALRVEVEGG